MLKDETVTGSRHRRNKARMDSGLGGEKKKARGSFSWRPSKSQ